MNTWLVVDGRQYYQPGLDLSLLNPKLAKHGLLTGAGTLRADTTGEANNATVTLLNDAGQMTAILRKSTPLKLPATLYRDGQAVLEGIVQSIALDVTCRIVVQA